MTDCFFVVCDVVVSKLASCVMSAGRINAVASVCDVIGSLKIPYAKNKVNIFSRSVI